MALTPKQERFIFTTSKIQIPGLFNPPIKAKSEQLLVFKGGILCPYPKRLDIVSFRS